MVLKTRFDRRSSQSIEDALGKLSDEKLLGDFNEIYKMMPVTADTSCGVGYFHGATLQK